MFGLGCDNCVRNGSCEHPCKSSKGRSGPNEFFTVAPNTGPGIEIMSSERAPGWWVVTATQTIGLEVERLYESTRLTSRAIADGLMHRLQKKRFPAAKVYFRTAVTYNESAI